MPTRRVIPRLSNVGRYGVQSTPHQKIASSEDCRRSLCCGYFFSISSRKSAVHLVTPSSAHTGLCAHTDSRPSLSLPFFSPFSVADEVSVADDPSVADEASGSQIVLSSISYFSCRGAVSTSTGYGYRACPNHDCCSIRSAEISPALHVGSC